MCGNHPLESIKAMYVKELRVKDVTKKKYERMLRAYIRYLKKNETEYARPADLIRYKRMLIKRGLKAESIQNHLWVIQGFYRWIRINRRRHGFDPRYEVDVSAALRPLRLSKTHKHDPLGLSQVRRLIEVAGDERDTLHGLRNYCAVLLMVTAGMRSAEIIRARKRDYKRIRGQHVLFVSDGRTGSHEAFIKLTKPVRHAINEYLFLRHDDHDRLFIAHHKRRTTGHLSEKALNHALRKLLKKAGISSSRKSLHSLRHACAVFSLRTGNTVYQTMRLMRHKSLRATLVHVKRMRRLNDDGEERIAKHIMQGKDENHGRKDR